MNNRTTLQRLALWGSVAIVMGGAALAAWSRPELIDAAQNGLRSQWASLGGADGQPGASVSAKRAPGGRSGATTPVAVEAARARLMRVSSDIPAIGTLLSDEAVAIAPEVAGRLAAISFEEGRPVKQGAVLARLDDSLTNADLVAAKAQLTLATANFERARVLARSGSVTDRSRDEAKADFDSAQAALTQAETRMAKLELRAPFDGVAGRRTVSVGAYLPVGTAIVNIEKIDRLKVDFSVPEIYLARIGVGQAIDVSVDAIPGRRFRGEIYAIDPLVDVNGRSLRLRARLENRDLALRPGLFARIEVRGLKPRDAVFVPESAVVPKAGRSFVFRIDDGKAIELPVVLGERRDGEVEVVQGLAGGALVVTAGQHNLRAGSAVEVVAAAAQQAPSTPQPDAAGKPGRAGGSG